MTNRLFTLAISLCLLVAGQAVAQNSLDDISELEDIRFVMKGGDVHKHQVAR